MPEKKRRAVRRTEPGGEPLEEEIAMLRVLIRRVHDLAEEVHALEDMLRILEVASLSSSRLASLLKTQRLLEAEPNPAGGLNAVMDAKIEELRKTG